MARIYANVEQMRSTARTLDGAAGEAERIAEQIGAVINHGSIPLSMRNAVGALERATVMHARRIGPDARRRASEFSDRAVRLEAACGGSPTGGGRSSGSGPGWADLLPGALWSAVGSVSGNIERVASVTDAAFAVAAGGVGWTSSTASRLLRTGHGTLQSLSGKWLPKLGPAARKLGQAASVVGKVTKVTTLVAGGWRIVDTYQRTPGGVLTKLSSANLELVSTAASLVPVVSVVDTIAGNPIQGFVDMVQANDEMDRLIATGDFEGAAELGRRMREEAEGGQYGWPLQILTRNKVL